MHIHTCSTLCSLNYIIYIYELYNTKDKNVNLDAFIATHPQSLPCKKALHSNTIILYLVPGTAVVRRRLRLRLRRRCRRRR